MKKFIQDLKEVIVDLAGIFIAFVLGAIGQWPLGLLFVMWWFGAYRRN